MANNGSVQRTAAINNAMNVSRGPARCILVLQTLYRLLQHHSNAPTLRQIDQTPVNFISSEIRTLQNTGSITPAEIQAAISSVVGIYEQVTQITRPETRPSFVDTAIMLRLLSQQDDAIILLVCNHLLAGDWFISIRSPAHIDLLTVCMVGPDAHLRNILKEQTLRTVLGQGDWNLPSSSARRMSELNYLPQSLRNLRVVYWGLNKDTRKERVEALLEMKRCCPTLKTVTIKREDLALGDPFLNEYVPIKFDTEEIILEEVEKLKLEYFQQEQRFWE